ncbi:MAG TPA: hypothetical protein VK399_11045 [Longimicrobiaceae bacterium]|nr:hypothetical protein [Longimicrobiaceae bacterium]
MTSSEIFASDVPGDELPASDPMLESGLELQADINTNHALAHNDADAGLDDADDLSSRGDGVRFGGYTSSYNGVKDCWYSSDGYVYDAAGNRVGTH